MLCPRCAKLISVSAPACPFCGARNPGLWGFGPAVSRLFGGAIDPISLIPRVCIGLYLIAIALDLRAALDFSGSLFGLLSPSSAALRLIGSTASIDLFAGRPWTLLTAIYLHGGILHIVFNLLWTRDLGPPVQQAFGPARFFIVWTIAGATGFLLSNLMPGPPSVGASGSIFGLLAALIVVGRATGSGEMARRMWQWAIVLGLMGFLLPGVDNLAHVGGFAGGWIAASALRRGIGRRDDRGAVAVALGLLILTGLGFAINFGEALGAFLSSR